MTIHFIITHQRDAFIHTVHNVDWTNLYIKYTQSVVWMMKLLSMLFLYTIFIPIYVFFYIHIVDSRI
jgi:hypothetical protein